MSGGRMRIQLRNGIGLAAMALMAIGCNSPAEPGRELVPGLITGFNSGDPQVALSVEDTSLSIEVVSYGGGCREKGELRVSKDTGSHRVTVAPYDWEVSGGICTTILNSFEHSATIDLGDTGSWIILVAGEDSESNPVEFEYEVSAGT
jgi:hypothetical protein